MLELIALARSPVGRFLGVLLLLGATYLAGLYKGHQWASNSQEKAILQETVKAQAQRLKDNEAIAQAAKERNDQLALSVEEYDKQIEDYKNELAKRPQNRACLPTDADLKRMRDFSKATPFPPAPKHSPGLW